MESALEVASRITCFFKASSPLALQFQQAGMNELDFSLGAQGCAKF